MPAAWERTLTRLVRDHADRLVRTAYLLCGDRSEAEDLVQEALVRVLARRRAVGRVADDEVAPHEAEAYLRRSMLNVYLDERRRGSRWRQVAHLVAPADRVDGEAAGVEERLDTTRALSTLPPRVRACMVLRYWADLAVDDVAAELELSAGTVKRYLSDGRALVAEHLEGRSLR